MGLTIFRKNIFMDLYEIKMMYRDKSREEIFAAFESLDKDFTDPKSCDSTPLHLAASLADPEAVRLLLDKGISANVKDRYGNFPLHHLAKLEAVRERKSGEVTEQSVRECADMLLDAGASVIRKNEDGFTALTTAAQNGRYEIIISAAEHGAKLTMTDPDGNTLLHLLCAAAGEYHQFDRGVQLEDGEWVRNCGKGISALVDADIDIDEKNDFGQTALDILIENGVKELTSILTGDKEGAATGGMTIFQAIEKQEADTVAAILKNGIELTELADSGMFEGMTPLGAAVDMLNPGITEKILLAGADPNFKNSKGENCLSALLRRGQPELNMEWGFDGKKESRDILKLLIKAGLDINGTVNDESDTALLLALRKAYRPGALNYHIAELLVESGCDINKTNLKGQNALMIASRYMDEGDLQATILESGADLDAVDIDGNTALHYTVQNSTDSMAKELTELLFDFGFSAVDAVNNEGKTALEIATERDNEPLVKYLLMKG